MVEFWTRSVHSTKRHNASQKRNKKRFSRRSVVSQLMRPVSYSSSKIHVTSYPKMTSNFIPLPRNQDSTLDRGFTQFIRNANSRIQEQDLCLDGCQRVRFERMMCTAKNGQCVFRSIMRFPRSTEFS